MIFGQAHTFSLVDLKLGHLSYFLQRSNGLALTRMGLSRYVVGYYERLRGIDQSTSNGGRTSRTW